MSVDYERFGLTREEEALLTRMWNYGMMGKGISVWRIVGTNTAITALLVYAVAAGSWIAGGVAIGWIIYNTVVASIYAARDVPLFHSAMTKIEAELERVHADDDPTAPQGAA